MARLACLIALVLPFASAAQAQQRLASTADITKEVVRTRSQNNRLINFWWLPLEFWEAAARERKMSEQEIDEVRRVFRDYLFVAAIEARVGKDGKPAFSKIAEIVERGRFVRNGETLTVLRQVSPRLAELAPQLVYSLRASLAMLGEGLVLLPLANLDRDGKPILQGTSRGDLQIEFRAEPGAAPLDFRWQGPLTAVVGPTACPKGGEPLEASWSYCPWHGVKAAPGTSGAKN